MSELNTAEIAQVTHELKLQARAGVSDGEVLTVQDSNGFELGVLAALKMVQAAGGEIPAKDELVAAIPDSVEATHEVVEEASANFGKKSQGPEALYVRI